MTDEEYDELRKPLLEQLSILDRDFHKMRQPIIDALVRIENIRPIRIFLDTKTYELLKSKS